MFGHAFDEEGLSEIFEELAQKPLADAPPLPNQEIVSEIERWLNVSEVSITANNTSYENIHHSIQSLRREGISYLINDLKTRSAGFSQAYNVPGLPLDEEESAVYLLVLGCVAPGAYTGSIQQEEKLLSFSFKMEAVSPTLTKPSRTQIFK